MDKLEEETKSAKRLALNIGKLLIALGLRRKTNECAAKEGLKNWKGQLIDGRIIQLTIINKYIEVNA